MLAIERHIAHCSVCRHRIDREERRVVSRDDAPSNPERAMYRYTGLWTSLGTVWVAGGPDGLIAVEFAIDEARFSFETELRIACDLAHAPGSLADARTQIAGYLAGHGREFTVGLDFIGLTSFQRDVYGATLAIPYGETRSYGEIAESLGKPGAGRAVGGALARCPFSFVVPCHRVVRANGQPGIYAPHTLGTCGPVYQAALIAHERTTMGERAWIE